MKITAAVSLKAFTRIQVLPVGEGRVTDFGLLPKNSNGFNPLQEKSMMNYESSDRAKFQFGGIKQGYYPGMTLALFDLPYVSMSQIEGWIELMKRNPLYIP